MRTIAISTVAAVLLSTAAYAGGPPVIESRVTSVGLFKNGLAVVRREVRLPGAGTFEIAGVPEPVPGTFRIESDARIEARVTSREFDMPLSEHMASDPD